MDLLQASNDASNSGALTLNLDALAADSFPPLTFLADASLWFEEHVRRPVMFEQTVDTITNTNMHVTPATQNHSAYMETFEAQSPSQLHTLASPHYTELGGVNTINTQQSCSNEFGIGTTDQQQQMFGLEADRMEVARIMEQLKKGWDGTSSSHLQLDVCLNSTDSNPINTHCTRGVESHAANEDADAAGILCRFDNNTLQVDLRALFTEELRHTMHRSAATRTIVPVQLRFPFGVLTIRLPSTTLWPSANRGPTLVPTETDPAAELVPGPSNQTVDKQGATVWKCELCTDKVFSTKHALSVHLRTHNDQRPHKCGVCCKAFRQSAHLQDHMLTHSNSRPHGCTRCDQSFVQKAHLSRHMRSCQVNKTLEEVEADRRRTPNIRRNACSDCEQGVSKLSRHVRTVHSQTRPHICTECGAEFKLAQHLRTHMAVHTPIKAHSCTLCNAAFSLKTHLQRHERSVHSASVSAVQSTTVLDSELQCKQCLRQFKRKDTLKEHMRSHDVNDQHRLACDQCTATFGRPAKLRAHKRSKHGIEETTATKTKSSVLSAGTVPCSNQCGLVFSRNSNMHRHLLSCSVNLKLTDS